MATIFETIADGLSDFAGDIKNAFNSKTTPSGPGKFLAYPNTLGDISSAIVYDSDHFDPHTNNLIRKSSFSAATGKTTNRQPLNLSDRINERNTPTAAIEPFIMMEFYRVIEAENLLGPRSLAAVALKENVALRRSMSGETHGQVGHLAHGNKTAIAAANRKILANEKLISSNNKRIDRLIHTRVLNKTIAMYMTAGIGVNDTMNYDQQSRTTAAVYDSMRDGFLDGTFKDKGEAANFLGNKGSGSTFKEDIKVLSSGQAAKVGGLFGWGASKLGKGANNLVGAALGGGFADIAGDEQLRNMGKALNPNEYMQYKNTALRSFNFQWKMLPDSAKESEDCQEIIKIFRGAAHAHKKSDITLSVPDYVHVSFHGVGGMVNMPACVISNVSIVYNPNAASFFRQNNNPVEIDVTITLSEIVPIYRDDVELGGL